jgi:hypothetical protein
LKRIQASVPPHQRQNKARNSASVTLHAQRRVASTP